MSNIDHEKLREDMIDKIVEENIAKTKTAAKKKLAEFEKQYEKTLQVLTPEARLRIIATRELGMQLQSEKEFIEQEPIQRTIGSLGVKEFKLVITAKVAKIVTKVVTLKTGEEKSVAELTISDNTGELQVGLWEENATWAEQNVSEGDIIRIHGGYTAESNSTYRPFDFKISKKGRVELLDRDSVEFPTLESQATTISQMRDKMSNVIFTGKIQNIYEKRVKTDGGHWISISVVDKNGDFIYVKLWEDNLVNIIEGPRIKEGHIVTFTSLRVNSYQGKLGLNSSNRTTINKLESQDANGYQRKARSGPITSELVSAEEGDFIDCVIKIIEIYPQKPYYDSCPNGRCKKGIKMDEETKELYCPNGHDDIKERDPIPIAKCSGMCTDGTASLKFGSMGVVAEKLLKMDAVQLKSNFDDIVRSSKEEGWEKIREAAKIFTKAYSEESMQGFHKITGKIRIDKIYGGNVEIMLNSIDAADYSDEADRTKNMIIEMVKEA